MMPGQDPFAMQKAVLENRLKNRAGWLTYAAGFSVINSILAVAGTHWHFVVGLGFSDVMMGIGDVFGGGSHVVGFILSLIPAAMFAFFGLQAARSRFWAFYVGMTLYALDGLLLLAFRDFLSAAFHGYVIYRMFEGLSAAKQLKALQESAARQTHFAGAPQPGAWPPPPSQGYPVPGAYPQPGHPQAPGYGQPQPGYGQPPVPGYGQPQPGWGQQSSMPPSWGQQPGVAQAPQPGTAQAPAQPGDWANQPGGIIQP